MINKRKKEMFAVLIVVFLLFNIGVFAQEDDEAREGAFGKALQLWFVSVQEGDTGIPIYDDNKLLIDFMIFFVIFLSISTLSLTKIFAKGGKNAAIGLSIALAAALALAAIKAGMSVTFFIPFVKNVLIFLLFIVIFLLFKALGIKSNFWNLVLSLIITLILFNVGNMIIDKDVQLNLRNLFGVPTAKPIDEAKAEAKVAEEKAKEAEEKVEEAPEEAVEDYDAIIEKLENRIGELEGKYGAAAEVTKLREKLDEIEGEREEAAAAAAVPPEVRPPKKPPAPPRKIWSNWYLLALLLPLLLLLSRRARTGIGRTASGARRAIKTRKKKKAKEFFEILGLIERIKDMYTKKKNEYKNKIVARTEGVKEERAYLDYVLDVFKDMFKLRDREHARVWVIKELKAGEVGLLSDVNLEGYVKKGLMPEDVKNRIERLKRFKRELKEGMPLETMVHYTLAGATVFKDLRNTIAYLIEAQKRFKKNVLVVMKLRKDELKFLKERIKDVKEHIEAFEKAEEYEKEEKHKAMLEHLTHEEIENKIKASLKKDVAKEKELKDFYSRLIQIYRGLYVPLMRVIDEFISIMKDELKTIDAIIQGKNEITLRGGKTTAGLVELLQTTIKEQNDKWKEEKELIKKLKASWAFQNHVSHLLEKEEEWIELEEMIKKEGWPEVGEEVVVWRYHAQKPEIWKIEKYLSEEKVQIRGISGEYKGKSFPYLIDKLLNRMRDAAEIPPVLKLEEKASKEPDAEKAIEIYKEVIRRFEVILKKEMSSNGKKWLENKIEELKETIKAKGEETKAKKIEPSDPLKAAEFYEEAARSLEDAVRRGYAKWPLKMRNAALEQARSYKEKAKELRKKAVKEEEKIGLVGGE